MIELEFLYTDCRCRQSKQKMPLQTRSGKKIFGFVFPFLPVYSAAAILRALASILPRMTSMVTDRMMTAPMTIY